MNITDAHNSVFIMQEFSKLSYSELTALFSIVVEMKTAKDKHPNWPNDIIHAGAIVSEESGEMIRACLQHKYEGGHFSEIRKEAIQTAATCIRLLTESKEVTNG